MADTVGWLVEASVKPGQLDTFEELMKEMVEGTSSEPGALNYEWYVAEDGSSMAIWEKYADSDAALTHFNAFLEKWAGRFMECCKPTRSVVYGSPDGRAKSALAAMQPVYMKHWGGFAR